MTNKIPIIGYGYGQSSRNAKSKYGPKAVQNATLSNANLQWQTIIKTKSTKQGLEAMDDIEKISKKLSQAVYEAIDNFGSFVVIGGDHSSAIGTWNGAKKHMNSKDLGLIWIDAHMDSHTTTSSHSKNIHGMPLAALLGHGDVRISQLLSKNPVIKPKNLKMIGISDYEPEEQALLKNLSVDIKYLEESQEPDKLISNAVEYLEKNTTGFGISLDLDVFCVEQAPAVTTYADSGISVNKTIAAIIKAINSPKFLGLEIAEFTPAKDINDKTLNIILKILNLITNKG